MLIKRYGLRSIEHITEQTPRLITAHGLVSSGKAKRKTRIAKIYGENNFELTTFRMWKRAVQQATRPDEIRTLLYYGLQPLGDAYMRGGKEQTPKLLQAIKQVITISQDYLVGYYAGIPPVKETKAALQAVPNPPSFQYRTKFRNANSIDLSVKPRHIRRHIQMHLDYLLSNPDQFPDTLVACAWGSSEVALPLARYIGVDCVFMRYSERRSDDEAKLLEDADKQYLQGRKIAVIDDMVGKGDTLVQFFTSIRRLTGSNPLYAATVAKADEPFARQDIDLRIKKNSFYLFTMPKLA